MAGTQYTVPIAKDLANDVAAVEKNAIGFAQSIIAKIITAIRKVKAKIAPVLETIDSLAMKALGWARNVTNIAEKVTDAFSISQLVDNIVDYATQMVKKVSALTTLQGYIKKWTGTVASIVEAVKASDVLNATQVIVEKLQWGFALADDVISEGIRVGSDLTGVGQALLSTGIGAIMGPVRTYVTLFNDTLNNVTSFVSSVADGSVVDGLLNMLLEWVVNNFAPARALGLSFDGIGSLDGFATLVEQALTKAIRALTGIIRPVQVASKRAVAAINDPALQSITAEQAGLLPSSFAILPPQSWVTDDARSAAMAALSDDAQRALTEVQAAMRVFAKATCGLVPSLKAAVNGAVDSVFTVAPVSAVTDNATVAAAADALRAANATDTPAVPRGRRLLGPVLVRALATSNATNSTAAAGGGGGKFVLSMPVVMAALGNASAVLTTVNGVLRTVQSALNPQNLTAVIKAKLQPALNAIQNLTDTYITPKLKVVQAFAHKVLNVTQQVYGFVSNARSMRATVVELIDLAKAHLFGPSGSNSSGVSGGAAAGNGTGTLKAAATTIAQGVQRVSGFLTTVSAAFKDTNALTNKGMALVEDLFTRIFTKVGQWIGNLADRVVAWLAGKAAPLLAKVKPYLYSLSYWLGNHTGLLKGIQTFGRLATNVGEQMRSAPGFGGVIGQAALLVGKFASYAGEADSIVKSILPLPDKLLTVDGVLSLVEDAIAVATGKSLDSLVSGNGRRLLAHDPDTYGVLASAPRNTSVKYAHTGGSCSSRSSRARATTRRASRCGQASGGSRRASRPAPRPGSTRRSGAA